MNSVETFQLSIYGASALSFLISYSFCYTIIKLNKSYKFKKNDQKRFKFIYQDLKASVHDELLKKIEDVNYIIHIGASSHVTKSVEDPRLFLEDNVVGTFNLLEASRRLKNLELF